MRILNFDFNIQLYSQNLVSLADQVRIWLFKADEDVFNSLPYENDNVFLEPDLFYLFLHNEEMPEYSVLEKTLFTFQDNLYSENKSIEFQPDQFGFVKVNGLGYFYSDDKKVNIDITGDKIQCENNECSFYPFEYIPDTSIKINFDYSEILIHRIHSPASISSFQIWEKVKENLILAWSIIQKSDSEFFNLLKTGVREIQLFDSAQHNSFADMERFGTAFLNVHRQDCTIVFFLDDIAHQCGHLLYFVLTLEDEKYLKVPKLTPLSDYFPDEAQRSVYGAFHGLFTYTTILNTLSNSLPFLTSDNKIEAYGRLGFYLNKFSSDLEIFEDGRILTEMGMDFYEMFKSSYNSIKERYGEALDRYDYSNQPYIFSFANFKKRNKSSEQIFI